MFVFLINSFLTQNVRFETIDDAVAARQALNGADIYSGCCTLKIEYARVSHPVLFLKMLDLKYFYLFNHTFFMFLDVKIECDTEWSGKLGLHESELRWAYHVFTLTLSHESFKSVVYKYKKNTLLTRQTYNLGNSSILHEQITAVIARDHSTEECFHAVYYYFSKMKFMQCFFRTV